MQECGDQSEIYNWQRIQLSNNIFINGSRGLRLTPLGLIKSVFSFQSAVYFAVLKSEFIIRARTNSQGRKMHSQDRRS